MLLRRCIWKLRPRKATTVFSSTLRATFSTSSTFENDQDSSAAQIYPETSPRMEKSINQVILLGRVGNQPQLRGTEEHPVTVFTLATHTNYKYSTGDLHQKTEWHRITVFKPFLRDSVYKYLSKGQRALVQGKIMYGQITDAGGTIHTTTSIAADEVIFFNKVTGQQQTVPDDDIP